MAFPPSGAAPSFKPFAPVRLALVAIAIPALSLVLASLAALVAMRCLGFSGVEGTIGGSGVATGAGIDSFGEAASLLFEAILLAATLAVAAQRERLWPARSIAWKPWAKDRSFLWFLGLMLTWQAVEGLLIEPRFPQLAQLSRLPTSEPAIFLSLLTVIVVAPVSEEVFFRGFLYTNLRAHVGLATAIIMSSLYFALLHYQESLLFPLLALPFGLVAGLAREHYDSVRPSIYLHAVWNLIAWGTQYFQPAAT